MPGLELAWALAFPRASTMRAQAAVVGNMLYLPVGDEARLFAIDVSGDVPCFTWVYESTVPLRTGAAYGVLPSGQPVVAFADAAVNVHLLDARTGKLLRPFFGHTSVINSVAFSPDSRILASGGQDQTIKRWPVDSN